MWDEYYLVIIKNFIVIDSFIDMSFIYRNHIFAFDAEYNDLKNSTTFEDFYPLVITFLIKVIMERNNPLISGEQFQLSKISYYYQIAKEKLQEWRFSTNLQAVGVKQINELFKILAPIGNFGLLQSIGSSAITASILVSVLLIVLFLLVLFCNAVSRTAILERRRLKIVHKVYIDKKLVYSKYVGYDPDLALEMLVDNNEKEQRTKQKLTELKNKIRASKGRVKNQVKYAHFFHILLFPVSILGAVGVGYLLSAGARLDPLKLSFDNFQTSFGRIDEFLSNTFRRVDEELQPIFGGDFHAFGRLISGDIAGMRENLMQIQDLAQNHNVELVNRFLQTARRAADEALMDVIDYYQVESGNLQEKAIFSLINAVSPIILSVKQGFEGVRNNLNNEDLLDGLMKELDGVFTEAGLPSFSDISEQFGFVIEQLNVYEENVSENSEIIAKLSPNLAQVISKAFSTPIIKQICGEQSAKIVQLLFNNQLNTQNLKQILNLDEDVDYNFSYQLYGQLVQIASQFFERLVPFSEYLNQFRSLVNEHGSLEEILQYITNCEREFYCNVVNQNDIYNMINQIKDAATSNLLFPLSNIVNLLDPENPIESIAKVIRTSVIWVNIVAFVIFALFTLSIAVCLPETSVLFMMIGGIIAIFSAFILLVPLFFSVCLSGTVYPFLFQAESSFTNQADSIISIVEQQTELKWRFSEKLQQLNQLFSCESEYFSWIVQLSGENVSNAIKQSKIALNIKGTEELTNVINDYLLRLMHESKLVPESEFIQLIPQSILHNLSQDLRLDQFLGKRTVFGLNYSNIDEVFGNVPYSHIWLGLVSLNGVRLSNFIQQLVVGNLRFIGENVQKFVQNSLSAIVSGDGARRFFEVGLRGVIANQSSFWPEKRVARRAAWEGDFLDCVAPHFDLEPQSLELDFHFIATNAAGFLERVPGCLGGTFGQNDADLNKIIGQSFAYSTNGAAPFLRAVANSAVQDRLVLEKAAEFLREIVAGVVRQDSKLDKIIGKNPFISTLARPVATSASNIVDLLLLSSETAVLSSTIPGEVVDALEHAALHLSYPFDRASFGLLVFVVYLLVAAVLLNLAFPYVRFRRYQGYICGKFMTKESREKKRHRKAEWLQKRQNRLRNVQNAGTFENSETSDGFAMFSSPNEKNKAQRRGCCRGEKEEDSPVQSPVIPAKNLRVRAVKF